MGQYTSVPSSSSTLHRNTFAAHPGGTFRTMSVDSSPAIGNNSNPPIPPVLASKTAPPKVDYFNRQQDPEVAAFKLDENELKKTPNDVFQIVNKLGEGSYGSVHRAIHKSSGTVLAIKKVPLDTDLQEIIKEITIMQQCDSCYVVKYYGSYFENSDLWVINHRKKGNKLFYKLHFFCRL
jgi:hypothetical protein